MPVQTRSQLKNNINNNINNINKKDIKDNIQELVPIKEKETKEEIINMDKKEYFHKIGLFIEHINWTEDMHTQFELFIEMLEHINKHFNIIYKNYYSNSIVDFTFIVHAKVDEFEKQINLAEKEEEKKEELASTLFIIGKARTIISLVRNTLSQTIIEYKTRYN